MMDSGRRFHQNKEEEMASSAHVYLNWAKERIDEMDAVLGSLESKAGQVAAESRATAEEIFVELRAKRDSFSSDMKKQAEASEGAWLQAKQKLESQWDSFQADAKKYVEDFGQQLNLQRATFDEVAAAQLKAWREAADKIQAASAEFAADRRAKVAVAVRQMKAAASATEANVQRFAKAGSESWTALDATLAESRMAFDHANQTAWDAFKRASPGA
jgi:hypothetical protein